MQSLPTVLLKPGEAQRVLAGHPWIYRGSILRLTKEVADGDAVQVKDHRQRFLGVGLFNAQSKISVRLLSSRKEDMDASFFEKRLLEAWRLRQRYLPNASSYRVVNSESDFLSGLIIDKYESACVVQFSSLGMDLRKELVLSALQRLLEPSIIVERSDVASRKFEGMAPATGILRGKGDSSVDVWMNGLRFGIDLLSGHKTGMYLDQQLNYHQAAVLAANLGVRKALDCFCFQGGFSLHLAKAGVTSVQGLDQSEEAVQAAARNADANGLTHHCTFAAANVFDWLKNQAVAVRQKKLSPEFDAIVLDPPSFTRNRASVEDALRGYKELHLRACQLLKPGGVLFTYCCSHHVSEELFENVILAAAFDAKVVIREVSRFTQSPDHPIIPSIPETKYLKGFALELV